jgi:diphthine-ammonia ligase
MKVAISWSGGIESALSCYKAIKEGHDVEYLVAFVADTWPSFSHPLPIMELQAKSMGIPLLKLNVKEPFEQTYREAIKTLVDKGIEGIVTGDIYVVDDLHGRWMDKVTEGLDISVIMPLWEQDTTKVLEEEVSTGFRSVFTSLGEEWFTVGKRKRHRPLRRKRRIPHHDNRWTNIQAANRNFKIHQRQTKRTTLHNN